MSRPTVFLSHSKNDQILIERLANDLRACRINSWYDDWEIPPGASLRRKIFEDAIPNCDSFFVYLTPHSIDSYWVQKELDALFIEQSRSKNVSILTFVDAIETRSKLSPDLAALSCPVINETEYETGFRKLLTSVFESHMIREINQRLLQAENNSLRLEKEIEELRREIVTLSTSGGQESSKIKEKLTTYTFSIDGKTYTALDVFEAIWPIVASGSNMHYLLLTLRSAWELSIPDNTWDNTIGESNISELVSPLIIWSVVQIQPPTDEHDQLYYLGEVGKELARQTHQ